MNKKYWKYLLILWILILIYLVFRKEIKHFNKILIIKSYYYRKLFIVIYEENIFLTFLFIFITEFIVILLPLPLYLITNAMIHLVLHKFVISIFILTFFSVISGYFVRLIFKNYFRNIAKNWLFNLTYYKILIKYGHLNPIYYTWLIRLLSIASFIKEYLLSFTNIPEKKIIFTSIIGYMYAVFQSILIGEGWDSYQNFILFEDDLKKKKSNKILMIVSIVLNILLLFLICFLTSLLYKKRI